MAIKPYSISLHNGTDWSRQHNIRGAGLDDKEEHIDANGYHKAFIDIPLKQSYFETFGMAIQEYNAKQTRSDRLIIDYLAKVRDEHKRSPSKKPHASYEMILEVGNREHHPSVEQSEKIMKEWLDEFQNRNPNVVVFGAYFHADEPEGAPHMHVDYYFVKRENKRGLSLQVSQNGALNEQGYFPIKENGKMVTPQTQFVRDSRELLRDISKEKGLYVDLEAKSSQGQKHLSTAEFKQTTKLKELQEQVSDKSKELEQVGNELTSARIEKEELERKNRIMEDIVQRTEFNIQEFSHLRKENASLKDEMKKKDEEISFLRKSINVLQRAFDYAKNFLKGYNIGPDGEKISMWKKFKSSFFNDKGKATYDEFQSVRHNTNINDDLYQHEMDYMTGERWDAPPGWDR